MMRNSYLFGFLEWWAGLSPVWQYAISLAMLGGSGLLWHFEVFRSWVWMSGLVIGSVLLLLAGGDD